MSKHIDKDKALEYIAPTIEVSEGYVSREVVLNLMHYWGGVYTDDKIIEMIESLPPIEPKPVCEDAISKGKLMTDLQGIWDTYTPNNMTDFQGILEDIYYKIKSAPSVEPKRPKGEWLDMSDGGRIKYVWYEKYMCNKCGERGTSAWSFCPNCGAYMRGSAENE